MDLNFKNNYIIYETEIRCIVGENELNYSQNPTLQTGSYGDLKEFAISDNFTPYATTVGLYNDNNELIAVAKLGQPLPISSTTDTVICVRIDM